jgi:hypothetical protein
MPILQICERSPEGDWSRELPGGPGELTFSMAILSGAGHHQATFGRRNPIAAHDNNNLVMNAGEWAG